MMYDWVDESLSSVLNSSSSSVVDINWSEHFQPNVAVDNCISSNPVGGASEPRVKSASKCRVTLTRRIQAKLRSRFDLKRYPFDHQFLEIRLKSRRVPQSGPHSATVVLSNPTTFRGKLGHILDPEADWMPEWNIVKIDGAPDGANSDFYRMQVCILRESTSVMTNIVLSLAVIMLLSFTSYGIEIDDFQDRVQVNVTLLLATMTFKFVLADKLPAVSYITFMDAYVVRGLATLSIQGIGFWIAVLIYRNERYFTSVFHMHDLAEFFDRMMLLLLAIWQISIHYEVLQLYRKSGVTVFMENTKINCKIDVSSKSASQVSRSAIELYSSSHSTRNITRPYPFHNDNDIKSSRRNEGMTTPLLNQIDGDGKKSGKYTV